MQNQPEQFSMQEAMRLASTPAGRQLFALLQQQNGDMLRQALNQAAAGDYANVQSTMAALLSDPAAQKLLAELRGNQNE